MDAAGSSRSWRTSGVEPTAVPRPAASSADFAHPWLRYAAASCGPGGNSEEASLARASVLHRLVNASGHLHWRTARLGWLRGSLSVQDFGAPLTELSFGWKVGTVQLSSWTGTCRRALFLAHFFYAAWRPLLEVGEVTETKEFAHAKLLESTTAWSNYLLAKGQEEPVHMHEDQLVLLLRSTVAMSSGTASPPCYCQLQYKEMLRGSIDAFEIYFHPEHISPGPSGHADHDEKLELLRQNPFCPGLLEIWHSYVISEEGLVSPFENQLSGSLACIPMRILHVVTCGQFWLHREDTEKAGAHFAAAAQMLSFSADCFDASVHVFDRPSWMNTLDLFNYFARLDDRVSPWRSSLSSLLEHQKPALTAQRSFLLRSEHNAALLPPLCFDRSGQLSLRVAGLTPGRRLRLFDWSGTWSLVPVSTPVEGPSKNSKGNNNKHNDDNNNNKNSNHSNNNNNENKNDNKLPDLEPSTAFIIHVDRPSWRTLGHTLSFIVPHIAQAFATAKARGGMPAVWRRRDSLQVYLRFPRNGQWETLGLGRRVAPEGGATRNPILLHWLQLLSPRPPLLLPDPEQPRLARNSTLPGSLQLAEIGPGGRCHPAGIWGSPNGMSKSELDLFVEVGRSFPQWGGRSQQELLHLIWGRRTDAVQDTPTQTDHCLNLTSAACIRVLVVRRGTSASASRSVVNIEDALSWISTAFSEKQVRVATVEMEQFSIGEEIALAGLVDFWISVYGSAMWWPIYMPPGACVMWLLPKVRWFYTAAHIPIDLANVHWTNFSLLEYGDLRPLLHVVVPGVLPPPGVPGHFELDEKLEKAHALAFQELDIFVNLDLFSSAFSDAVQYLVVQKSEYV